MWGSVVKVWGQCLACGAVRLKCGGSVGQCVAALLKCGGRVCRMGSVV